MEPKLRSISWNDIGKLQLDEKNNLYWDGKPVQTRINLSWWVDASVVLAGIGTFGTFAIDVFKLLVGK